MPVLPELLQLDIVVRIFDIFRPKFLLFLLACYSSNLLIHSKEHNLWLGFLLLHKFCCFFLSLSLFPLLLDSSFQLFSGWLGCFVGDQLLVLGCLIVRICINIYWYLVFLLYIYRIFQFPDVVSCIFEVNGFITWEPEASYYFNRAIDLEIIDLFQL